MQITGLDLSLTATGIARLAINRDEDGTHTHVLQLDVITTATAGPDYDARADRLAQIRHDVINAACPADLVVIEGPSFGSASPGTWDRAGLWWLTVNWLVGLVPVAVVPPSSLKKFATGRGNATKPDMRVALLQRLDRDERDDNAVDAAWLALAGAHHLGAPVIDLPKAHTDALAKVAWPEPHGAVPAGRYLMAGAGS